MFNFVNYVFQTHVISFLNKMMTLPPLDQEQPQELVKTKRLKHHSKH